MVADVFSAGQTISGCEGNGAVIQSIGNGGIRPGFNQQLNNFMAFLCAFGFVDPVPAQCKSRIQQGSSAQFILNVGIWPVFQEHLCHFRITSHDGSVEGSSPSYAKATN